MNIFIDESGSFVTSSSIDSWNCVVGYMSPEQDRKNLKIIVDRLKRTSGASIKNELKLKDVAETDYINFLASLGKLNGILFSVAMDTGRHTESDVIAHRDIQTNNITKNIDKMKHEGGRIGLQNLSKKTAEFSPQLYAQLHSQIQLVCELLKHGILYFVQRNPKSLGTFRWRIDEKNSTKPVFEETLVTLLPVIMQSRSLDEPMISLIGADYSSFSRFYYAQDKIPDYLEKDYGIPRISEELPIDIGMLIRENINFEDSKTNIGIQIADLLASGLRRCLRGGFNHNLYVAKLIGSLLLKTGRSTTSLFLLGFLDTELSSNSEKIIKTMNMHTRHMLI